LGCQETQMLWVGRCGIIPNIRVCSQIIQENQVGSDYFYPKTDDTLDAGNLGHTSELYIWNGLCVFWGTSFYTSPHSHNTLQVVFDIEKEFLVKDANTEWRSYNAVIIDANHRHQLDSNNSIQLFMYLEPDSVFAQRFRQKYLQNSPIQALPLIKKEKGTQRFLKELLVKNHCVEMFEGCTEILQELLSEPKGTALDKRVFLALDYITKSSVKDFKVKDIASASGLSESRLRHLFKEQVGQSIQSFVKWMRVIDALNDVLKGKKLVQTAYDHGFSDASHMTKSFVEVVGVPPSKIKTYEKTTKIRTCQDSRPFTLRTHLLENWSE